MTRFRANMTFFSSSSSKLWEISFSSRSILLSFYIYVSHGPSNFRTILFPHLISFLDSILSNRNNCIDSEENNNQRHISLREMVRFARNGE